MPITAPYLFVVSMDVDPDHEDLFHEVYDTEHIPYLLEVPGVLGAQRMKGEAVQVAVGGEIHDRPAPSPVFTAIYEIESPEVLTSAGWQEAVERGRWPSVRPYTSNRSQQFFKMRG
ncbi:MAG: hypothetical protein AAF409_04010 [Pseudomonadota bacterium]